MIDPLATKIFADGGIALGQATQSDFVWTHDVYLRSEPEVKDIEIRIHKDNYMGEIVHRETHFCVHFDHAASHAEGVLVEYKASLKVGAGDTATDGA